MQQVKHKSMSAGVRKPLQIDEELVTQSSFTRKAAKLVHSRCSLVSADTSAHRKGLYSKILVHYQRCVCRHQRQALSYQGQWGLKLPALYSSKQQLSYLLRMCWIMCCVKLPTGNSKNEFSRISTCVSWLCSIMSNANSFVCFLSWLINNCTLVRGLVFRTSMQYEDYSLVRSDFPPPTSDTHPPLVPVSLP